MEPDLLAEFCVEFTAYLNRLRTLAMIPLPLSELSRLPAMEGSMQAYMSAALSCNRAPST